MPVESRGPTRYNSHMTKKRAQISLAVIGCGHWGKNYARNFSEIEHCSVRWLCDVHAPSLRSLARRYPTSLMTTKPADVLQDGEVDAVIIATTASTHYQLAKMALLAGKDVLVEKPLALSAVHAAELMRLAARRKRILMVGHTFLYNPAVRKLKQLIDSGRIGRLYYLKAVRSHLGLIRQDVDVLWDLATHDVAIFNYLLGAVPSSAQATGVRFISRHGDDAAFVTYKYGKQLAAHVHVSWADSNKQRIVEVVGSKGRLVFDDLNTQEPIRIFERGVSLNEDAANFGEFKYQFRDGDIISPKINMQEPLKLQCEHFLQSVLTRNAPLTDGRNGLEVVQAMELAHRALKAGRK